MIVKSITKFLRTNEGNPSTERATIDTATKIKAINPDCQDWWVNSIVDIIQDGDLDGVYSSGSASHTLNETNSWWEVDLDANYSIEDIVVYRRTDACCIIRLSNYTAKVYILE